MLDANKRYFVAAGENLKSFISGWAVMNSVDLKGEDVSLANCRRAYELDVSRNNNLTIAIRQLGADCLGFINGERLIGQVMCDMVDGVPCVVVYPDLRTYRR